MEKRQIRKIPIYQEDDYNEGEPKYFLPLVQRTVPYTVKRSGRAKTIRLQVEVETGLVVIVPKEFPEVNLNDILRKKQSWILEKLDMVALAGEKRLSHRKGSLLYRGREYLLEIRKEPGAPSKVLVEEGKLVVVIPEGKEKDAREVLEKWLHRMARLLIHQRIRVVNETLQLSFNRVFIRGQKTRWGSCSHRRNLNFNWRLVMAPLPVIDYIVIHELMHLIELNHSKKFWALVEGACPDYKTQRDWLKKNGTLLTLE